MIHITVIHPLTREKSVIIAYSREHAKKIIRSVIEQDKRRVKVDSKIVEELVNELRGDKTK